MSNTVFFDMDGTIVDLYGVENVFKRLDNGDATPYAEAKAINEEREAAEEAVDDTVELNEVSEETESTEQ